MDERTLEQLASLVRGRLGLRPGPPELTRLGETLEERSRALRLRSLPDYVRLLESAGAPGGGPEAAREWRALVALVTNGESYFFRDRGLVTLLRERLLPELIARRRAQRAPGRNLRIWSAGCSTGEEPYTLAILLDRLLPDREQWRVLLLATDVDEEALQRARQGLYRPWSFRAVAPEELGCFQQRGDRWEIRERYRRMVTFRAGNLVTDPFPGPEGDLFGMDLILCRNVFIYFEPAAVRSVLRKLEGALAADGCLVAGHAELHGQELAGFEPLAYSEAIVYRRRAPAAPPRPAPHAQRAPAPLRSLAVRTPAPAPSVRAGDRACAPGAEDWEAELTAAQARADLGDHADAERHCREASARAPFRAEPYVLLARLAEEQGRVPEAEELWKRVLYLDPAAVVAYVELALHYDLRGEEARAGKMRASAAGLLRALPADAPVPHLDSETAGGLLRALTGGGRR